ncbi:MAG: peptidase domain-containing ABC transporter [Crocinitomicaceae bacterium]
MNSKQITNILYECARELNIVIDSSTLEWIDSHTRNYGIDELDEYIRDLTEAGNKNNLVVFKKEVPAETFDIFTKNFDAPVITFVNRENKTCPLLISGSKAKKGAKVIRFSNESMELLPQSDLEISDMVRDNTEKIIILTVFAYDSISGSSSDEADEHKKLTPVRRLIRLLATERRDIIYIYIYAIIIGISTLILPLGIQAAIELISGGVFFSSIYILIGFIIFAVLGSGVLQVFQISIVEYLQRRVFTRAALEFAYRVPRIKMEAVMNMHFPELMNRFFDVLTIQKGLPKLLIDLSTGAIQILFGLLLLSFYHPFFVLFGLILIFTLFMIFYTTGPKALTSSIIESKYKYKAVYWLEELARSLYSFKLSGSTFLPIKKTDYFVNNYLKNRKAHFNILITQYAYVLLFKAIVTAGLLIIGTVLVVQREITLGQFVASEVIIILILNSVEKIISYIDVVYDMLTAVDKIAHVTDLPLERSGGIDIPARPGDESKGFEIIIKNLSYTYPNTKKPSVKGIDLHVNAGERICISGVGASGKTTLTNTIAGVHDTYEGVITYNGYSLRDLDRTHLRDMIGKNVSTDDIFEGTLLDNILVGRPMNDQYDAHNAIKRVGLSDAINSLPKGLNTQVLSGGKGFSETFIQRLILARCLTKRPKLLILNDFFANFSKSDRLELVNMLISPDNNWTLIVVSNDPLIMSACDKVYYLSHGDIVASGSFEDVIQHEEVVKNLY